MCLINILQVLEQNKLQSSQTQKSTLLNSSHKNKSPSSSFPFQPITPDEVKFEIMSVPVNKSHGFYSFLTFILKYPCDNIFKDILANIFNRSLEPGKYPSKLKTSIKVMKIFKADDESDPNNYRPISLLSSFNRIFEKLMYTRTNSFIDKEGILCSLQIMWV